VDNERSHLDNIEQLPGPVGREQHAARFLSSVPNANFVVDVAVWDGHVGEHKIGKKEPLEHLGEMINPSVS
jgi:hypothetical protein